MQKLIKQHVIYFSFQNDYHSINIILRCKKDIFSKKFIFVFLAKKCIACSSTVLSYFIIQVSLEMTDLTGPGKLVRQNPSYTYDEYLICIGLGPSILSVVCKNPSYSGSSYPSSPVVHLRLDAISIIFFKCSYSLWKEHVLLA